jgi:hypothetical protein
MPAHAADTVRCGPHDRLVDLAAAAGDYRPHVLTLGYCDLCWARRRHCERAASTA